MELDDAVSIEQDPSMFEKEPNENIGIKIRNLRKVNVHVLKCKKYIFKLQFKALCSVLLMLSCVFWKVVVSVFHT